MLVLKRVSYLSLLEKHALHFRHGFCLGVSWPTSFPAFASSGCSMLQLESVGRLPLQDPLRPCQCFLLAPQALSLAFNLQLLPVSGALQNDGP